MDDEKLKEQLDKMIRDSVREVLDKMGITVSLKDLPNSSEIERLLQKEKQQEKNKSKEE